MSDGLFLAVLALGCLLYLGWGFRVLPKERWQILASVPLRMEPGGQWQGLNLTWYGLLSANAYWMAAALFWVLLRARGTQEMVILLFAALLLALCVPASSWMARLVEGKTATLTVGGAVFVGLLASPLALVLTQKILGVHIELLPLMAALGAAYALGEGLGRLACVSFGCCYGKPLEAAGPLTKKLFGRFHFAFAGATKKAAYAGNLEGRPLVPIQAITALIYLGVALAGSFLFLRQHYGAGFLLCVLGTQLWRVCSETLRCDWRGGGRLSAYQWMGLICIPFALLVSLVSPVPMEAPVRIAEGLGDLWQPAPLVALHCLWLGIFLFTGRSLVTGSTMQFHVHGDRI